MPCASVAAPRAVRSEATSNIHGNGLTIYHSSSQIVPSLFKVSSLSLRLPSPYHFFSPPASSQLLVSQTMQYLLNKRRRLDPASS